MLKEEVEEMKATLSCTEEGRARASAHSKHVVSVEIELIFLSCCLAAVFASYGTFSLELDHFYHFCLHMCFKILLLLAGCY